MTPVDGSGGPLDVATLEVMGQRATTHPLVANWRFRPDAISPRRLELHLDVERYPDDLTAARLDVRWLEDGAHTIHYLESRGDDVWQCRWDRHPKPGSSDEHFHPPPEASPDIEPSDFPANPHLDVLFAVLTWVDDRVHRLYER